MVEKTICHRRNQIILNSRRCMTWSYHFFRNLNKSTVKASKEVQQLIQTKISVSTTSTWLNHRPVPVNLPRQQTENLCLCSITNRASTEPNIARNNFYKHHLLCKFFDNHLLRQLEISLQKAERSFISQPYLNSGQIRQFSSKLRMGIWIYIQECTNSTTNPSNISKNSRVLRNKKSSVVRSLRPYKIAREPHILQENNLTSSKSFRRAD